ncbi:hypothetical protein KRP22_009671 [Phytophthora ramorum]|nr:hypothetical protein KRP22_14616 [Phytophthora ramorum]
MKLKTRVGDATGVGTGMSLKEAEMALRSSITVREQHKAKLRALLSIIAPHTWSKVSSEVQIRSRTKSVSKDKPRKTRESVGVRIPEVAEGKEIHVLGDVLLLTRAASVDVVENIQTWRTVVHQGMPRPYVYENENYMLTMCEDLDFLDQAGELAEWLGFRLLRNPFIVNEALDDVVSSRLALSVHDDRSLKYWNSTSWKLNNKLATKRVGLPNASEASPSRQASKARWKQQPPPPPLIKPLASICPEDDVVDGLRIATAQEVLLEEESFHGRLRGLRAAREYVDRGPSVLEPNDVDNNAPSPTVYDAMAALNIQLRSKGGRLSLIRRERTQVERTLQDIHNQMRWTELRRDCDRTKDHRVWTCRDMYRQEVLKTYNRLAERLERCLSSLEGDEKYVGGALDICKGQLSELRLEKDKQRATRHTKKQQEESTKRSNGRQKAEERRKVRSKKKSLQRRSASDLVQESLQQKEDIIYENIAVDFQSDIRAIESKKSGGPAREQESPGTCQKLEEKRQRAIYQKRARLEQHARTLKDMELVLDRRRAENVAMKWEDALARAVEREARRKTILRSRKARLDRVASCAMFKCMHEMNGKRFLVSVYIRHARGYDLEGLRIVAYDPSSSAAFTMEMPLRVFNSLGYGRTSDGLGGFCKWLCLLYEKRRRQFRLVWSGTPCPPPLRVRENDQALVCIHKEGVKLRHSASDRYSLVAVYLRRNDPSILRFVVGSCYGQEFLLTEHAVSARWLIVGSDLDVQWKSSGHAVIVWKHHTDALEMQEEFYSSQDGAEGSANNAVGPRIYSSEVIVRRVRYSVHLYDTDETKYTVELIPKAQKGQIEQSKPVGDRLVLNKRDVNPYDVHLSSSSFADLFSLICFEHNPPQEPKREDASDPATRLKWKATVSPKWTGKLANYVRVLRLAKYACKVGGVFCFVAVFVVQQKTEFRAHLLLEFTWLAPTLSSFPPGGAATRQSLRIALSDYLVCTNASRRFAVGLEYSGNEREGGDEECPSCSTYDAARTKLHANDVGVPETAFDCTTSCSNCAMIQQRRLRAIKELVIHAGAIAPESLEVIYHGYCDVCATLAPPIVLVIGSAFSATMNWLLPLLEQYFVSFDCGKHGFLRFAEGDQGHVIAEEGIHVRETVLQTLARDQVAVLFNADCGMTVGSANLFVHELHWWLYPDFSELPCHVAYAVSARYDHVDDGSSFEQKPAGIYRDHDLLEALQALRHAACQVAELTPVYLDDGGEEGGDHASAFDAYLVAEAVLIEATRVLLHPDYAWQKPRKIVGASSWNTACSYLLDPVRLGADLQRCDPLGLCTATAAVLEEYFVHVKWPHEYADVRPFFYGLLVFMMHVQHVRRIVGVRSGSLQAALTAHHGAEQEVLAQNTSIIDCSHFDHVTEATSHVGVDG